MVKCRCGSWKLATFDAKHCHCLRETKVFGFRGKYGCRPPGELKTGRPPQPQYTCGECVVLCYYRANTGLPPTCLLLVDWVNCGNSMSERTHCDDDLTGLLSPSRQPSVADVSTGGRESLLVEAIYFGWFSHPALTSRLGLCLQWGSLALIWLRVPTVLSSGSLTYEYFGFQGLTVANRGEDRSFHIMKGSVPIWTSGLAR